MSSHAAKDRDWQIDAMSVINERRSSGERRTNISACTGSGKSRLIQMVACMPERRVIVFPRLVLLTQFWKDPLNPFKTCPNVLYCATEGTLGTVKRLEGGMRELSGTGYVVLTTYASAPLIFEKIMEKPGRDIDLLIHDEAHHVVSRAYSSSLKQIETMVRHRLDFSATLPETSPPDYKYSLLRGIKDVVVRDFNMEVFLCTDGERDQSRVFVEIVEELKKTHKCVKLLVYTSEANTDEETSSSVKTYLTQNRAVAAENGWWFKGLNKETESEKGEIMAKFQQDRPVSILVSCRTLSEGVDLTNANCVMPWDSSKSYIDIIQKVGRVLRLYKDARGEIASPDVQSPSTVFIPVFLSKTKFVDCGGEGSSIHDCLEKEITLGMNGNFMPFVSVCSALKDQMADEDEDLFNQLVNLQPKVRYTHNAIECLAKHLKKTDETLRTALCECLDTDDEDLIEAVHKNDWDEDSTGEVMTALAKSQERLIVIVDGDNNACFGEKEHKAVVLKKNPNDNGYKVCTAAEVKKRKAAIDRVSNRMRIGFSRGCLITLGLEDADADLCRAEGNYVASRLSATVRHDAHWEKRFEAVVAFYIKNERWPSSRNKDPEKRSLGQWCSKQRGDKKKFDKGEKSYITQERIDELNAVDGWVWVWDKPDVWHQSLLDCVAYYKENGAWPSSWLEHSEKRSLSYWCSTQRGDKKKFDKGKKSYITQERIDELNAVDGWVWDRHAAEWNQSLLDCVAYYKENGVRPSGCDKDPEKRSLGKWCGTQCGDKRKFDKGEKSYITQERIDKLNTVEGWCWAGGELRRRGKAKAPADTKSEEVKSPPASKPSPKPRRRLVLVPSCLTEEDKKEQRKQKVRNEMTEMHKRYKHMKHGSFAQYMQANPQDWHSYHAVADEHDARDREDHKPNTRIANTFLARMNRSNYTAIDLGCGKDRLRHVEGANKMSWKSVDVIADNDSVTVANMGALPFEDDQFDVAVMNRSLWATDRVEVLVEAFRVLKVGGRLIICEAWGKWHKEDGMRLPELIVDAGFTVKRVLGAEQEESEEFGCWHYIECVKE